MVEKLTLLETEQLTVPPTAGETPSTKILPLLRDPERLENRLKEIPPEPGVYFMRDAADRVIYIGKSRKLRSRVRSYFRDSQRSERTDCPDGAAGGGD